MTIELSRERSRSRSMHVGPRIDQKVVIHGTHRSSIVNASLTASCLALSSCCCRLIRIFRSASASCHSNASESSTCTPSRSPHDHCRRQRRVGAAGAHRLAHGFPGVVVVVTELDDPSADRTRVSSQLQQVFSVGIAAVGRGSPIAVSDLGFVLRGGRTIRGD